MPFSSASLVVFIILLPQLHSLVFSSATSVVLFSHAFLRSFMQGTLSYAKRSSWIPSPLIMGAVRPTPLLFCDLGQLIRQANQDPDYHTPNCNTLNLLLFLSLILFSVTVSPLSGSDHSFVIITSFFDTPSSHSPAYASYCTSGSLLD